MSKNGKLRKVLVAGLIGLALGLSSCRPEAPAEAAADPNLGYDFAAVDYKQLVELHPNYPKLLEIDQKIVQKEREKASIGAEAFKQLQADGATRMKSAVEKAKAKLEAERSAIEGEMSALSASLSAQIEGEMRGVKARLEGELQGDIDELKKKTPGASKEPAAPPPPSRNEGQVQDYIENLNMVRERNLAARRLELEKRVGDEVNAKKAEVDGQIAAYEADLSAQYQSERLNLQLAAQNSADEAAKTAAEERLGEIGREIDAKKAARRAELDASYASVRSEATARLQADLERYQNELNAEVSANVARKRQELGGRAPAEPRPTQPQGPPPELQQKIAEMQSRMQAELNARKAELTAQMQAKGDQARSRLKAKQEQVEAELKKIEEEITREVAARLEQLDPETKKKVTAAEQQVEELQKQRKEMADSIAADISREVGRVAQKKDVDMVIGVVPNFEWTSYPDMTEQAKVAVQVEDSK